MSVTTTTLPRLRSRTPTPTSKSSKFRSEITKRKKFIINDLKSLIRNCPLLYFALLWVSIINLLLLFLQISSKTLGNIIISLKMGSNLKMIEYHFVFVIIRQRVEDQGLAKFQPARTLNR